VQHIVATSMQLVSHTRHSIFNMSTVSFDARWWNSEWICQWDHAAN